MRHFDERSEEKSEISRLRLEMTKSYLSPKKVTVTCFFLVTVTLAFPAFAAYTDTIQVTLQEAWQAAFEVLHPYGIRKKDLEKGILECGWSEDQVVRSRGLLKKVFHQIYERRSRFELRFKEDAMGTTIEIRGKFQERQAGSRQSVWRTVKPESQDYELERELFEKILRKIEQGRK